MIVALYARKSTDQAGAGDKSESVERQIAHARAYAVRRPGLARLLNALRPAAAVPGPRDERGVAPRPRVDRSGLRAQGVRPGRRARVPVPRYAQVSTKKQRADIARYLEGGA
jgi:hypothetical protein